MSYAAPAAAFDRTKAELFATLPLGATGPEGLAVDSNGNVYVATFGFNATGGVAGPGKIYVFRHNGDLLRTLSVTGSTSHLLGLAFQPGTGALLAIDNTGGSGEGKVFKVDKMTGSASPFITLPAGKAATSSLNAMTFDASGNIYVSDSAQGIIWRTGSGGGEATAWVTDDLLKTSGVPPFGANGMGFNKAGDTLFVANTGNDTIVKIPVSSGTAGTPVVFVNSINGADGLLVDDDDNLWVAANQSDEIDMLDSTGKLIGRLGEFEGLTRHGMPVGLLFPATPQFGRGGRVLYVTNLALDLRLFGLPQAVDSQWAAQVNRYTVSRIRTNIRPLRGGN